MANKRKIVRLISGLLFCTLQLVLPPLSLYPPFPPHSFSPNALSVHKALGMPFKNKKEEGRKEGKTQASSLGIIASPAISSCSVQVVEVISMTVPSSSHALL